MFAVILELQYRGVGVLHIILLILKIVGYILLGIIGLLLALMLIVLFVPVCYELSGKYDDDPEAEGKVSWLFGALKVQGGFKEKKLRARVNFLWFRLFDTEKRDSPEEAEAIPDPVLPPVGDETIDIGIDEKAEKESDVIADDAPSVTRIEPPPSEKKEKDDRQDVPTVQKKPSQKKQKFDSQTSAPESRESLGEKIQKVFVRAEKSIDNVRKKWEKLSKKKNMAEKLWNADFVQNSLAFGKKALISILKKIRPGKISGNILFGLGKPSDTGKVLGYASMLYGLYGNAIVLCPDFEKAVFKGDLRVKGSLQLYIFVYWGLRAIMNKNIRKLIACVNHIRKGKEETLWQ